MLGAFFTKFNLISWLFRFQASSDTTIVNAHSSLIVVHDVTAFQLMDKETVQLVVLSSLHDATKTSPM